MGRGLRAGIVAVALLGLLTAGCAPTPPGAGLPGDVPSGAASPPESARAPDAASVRLASEQLGRLRVDRGVASAAYDRDAFGPAWADIDRNGCDTRNDVLGRDLTHPGFRPGTHGCTVEAGTLVDPYDGARVSFASGPDTSPLVQIDHVVSLSYAWRHGADRWTAARRLAFANDPRDLLAVTEAMNDAKGPLGPGQWLPPSERGRCVFVVRWVGVLSAYALTIHPGDRAAASAVLIAC